MRRLCAAALGLAAAIALSPPAAADPAAALRDALEALHAEHGFPGATAACVLPDGSVLVAATGLADVDAGTPMRPDDRMLAASIGKTFTGAMMLALSREGRLGLDDALAEWLGEEPWYARLPNHDTITLRHLLRHRSGLPDHVYDAAFGAEFAQRIKTGRSFAPGELIGYVLDEEPLFRPGEGFAYTDTGYVLLGLVVEKATGESYYEGVARRFLEPIGLAHTSPSDRRDLAGLVPGYLATDNPFGLPAKTLTGTGCWSSIRDSNGPPAALSATPGIWPAGAPRFSAARRCRETICRCCSPRRRSTPPGLPRVTASGSRSSAAGISAMCTAMRAGSRGTRPACAIMPIAA